MKLITHIKLEIEVEDDYKFSLNETEKMNQYIQYLIDFINTYLHRDVQGSKIQLTLD